MATNRRPPTRPPARAISAKAVDIFDSMEKLELYSDEWWELNSELHREMRLHLWEYPAYADYDDNGTFDRYLALKAASDVRKQT
jgi:hypothetical protein